MIRIYRMVPLHRLLTLLGLMSNTNHEHNLTRWRFKDLINTKLKTVSIAFAALLLLNGTAIAGCPKNLDFTKRYLASEQSVRLCEAYAVSYTHLTLPTILLV